MKRSEKSEIKRLVGQVGFKIVAKLWLFTEIQMFFSLLCHRNASETYRIN